MNWIVFSKKPDYQCLQRAFLHVKELAPRRPRLTAVIPAKLDIEGQRAAFYALVDQASAAVINALDQKRTSEDIENAWQTILTTALTAVKLMAAPKKPRISPAKTLEANDLYNKAVDERKLAQIFSP